MENFEFSPDLTVEEYFDIASRNALLLFNIDTVADYEMRRYRQKAIKAGMELDSLRATLVPTVYIVASWHGVMVRSGFLNDATKVIVKWLEEGVYELPQGCSETSCLAATTKYIVDRIKDSGGIPSVLEHHAARGNEVVKELLDKGVTENVANYILDNLKYCGAQGSYYGYLKKQKDVADRHQRLERFREENDFYVGKYPLKKNNKGFFKRMDEIRRIVHEYHPRFNRRNVNGLIDFLDSHKLAVTKEAILAATHDDLIAIKGLGEYAITEIEVLQECLMKELF